MSFIANQADADVESVLIYEMLDEPKKAPPENRFGLMYELLDHYLGLPKQDWPAKFGAFRRDRIAAAEAVVRQQAAAPAGVGPSLPLERYTGSYSDPWYGTIAARETNGHLEVDFPHMPGLKATLDHYQYDTFRTRFNDPSMEAAYMTFALGAEGKVERITMKPVSPIADFSFDYQDLLFTPAQ